MVQVAPPPGWTPPTPPPPGNQPETIVPLAPEPSSGALSATPSPSAAMPAVLPETVQAARAADSGSDAPAAARNWHGMWLTAGVVAVLVAGIGMGFYIRSRRDAASRPVTTAKNSPAAVQPAREAPAKRPADPGAAGQRDAEQQPAPVVAAELVPTDARLICSFRLAGGSPAAAAWFEFLAPLWAGPLDLVAKSLVASSNPVERFTWVSTDLDDWSASGVAIFEFRAPLSTAAPLVPDSAPLDWKLLGATVYKPPEGAWQQPFALVNERTLVTGSEEILKALASAAATAAVEDEPEAVTIAVPGGHDLVWHVRFGEEPGEVVASWTRLADRILFDEEPGLSAVAVQSLELIVDCDDTTARAELAIGCKVEEDATRLDERIGQQRPGAASRLAELIGQVRDDPQDADHHDQATLQTQRFGATVRLRAEVPGDMTRLGIAAILETPAIESVRQLAALALGETQLGRFAGNLARAAQSEQTFPAAAAGSALLPAESRLSWIATLLPYFGHDDWHKQLNLARSWQDPANQAVTRQVLPEALNPAFAPRRTSSGYPVAHYVGIAGVGADAAELAADDPRAGVFGAQPRRVDQVKDGTASTIAVMGVRQEWGPWSAGGPSTARSLTRQPYVNGPDGFGTGQADGMLVGMADGSARFVSSNIDPKVLEQLSTIAGGETEAITAIERSPEKVEPPTAEQPGVPAAPAVPPPPAEGEVAVRRGGGVREVDLAARLNDRIPFLQVERMPLAEFLRLIQSLSTLSISIDFDSFPPPGVARLPVTLKVQKKSVEAILGEALAEHGLALVTEGDQLVVRPADAGAAPVRESYDVADLVGAERAGETANGDDLAALVRQFVEPASWNAQGGQGTVSIENGKLVVEQPPIVQRQVADFLDRLRVARGKHRLSADEAALRLASPWTAAKARLAPQISVNFPEDTPLARILEYLGEKSGVELVVDWRTLRDADTGPGALAGLHIQNQRLDNTLTALVEPLGLAYRPIDAETVEISTPQHLDQTGCTAFYQLKPLLATGQAAEAVADRLRNEVLPDRWRGTPPAATAAVDPASGYLIVRGPPNLLRAVDIAFATWNAESTENKQE